ncbi:hypothetical protein T07_11959 [Trichinella nelsoni]|uniref:Uncharacterized protein n=1 Tax=Trichinella nelsoni TaxID=6336 RepID=A0A0V0RP78_9BILA|nr:hypothetical protein T07_7443 [Trichinella nelsoni]KRX16297.1 hypothetical protein T07_11959 [Trichinella nelsoni]
MKRCEHNDSWECSVLPPARYLQPSAPAEVASTFRALRELLSTLAPSETKAAVQQGQTTAVSSDWATMMVPVRQGGQLSSNEEVCCGESQVVFGSAFTIVRGRSLILASISQSTVRSSSGSALLRPRSFVSATFTDLTSRSQYPPHHGALSVMNLHSIESSLNHLPVVVAEERLRGTSGQAEPLLSDRVIIWQGTAGPLPKEADSIPHAIKREVPLELLSFEARQRSFFFRGDPNGFELPEFPQ